MEYTAESKAKIDAARTAYDALTEAQKALATKYDMLTAAENTYAVLADKAAAKAVEGEPRSHAEDAELVRAEEHVAQAPEAAGLPEAAGGFHMVKLSRGTVTILDEKKLEALQDA